MRLSAALIDPACLALYIAVVIEANIACRLTVIYLYLIWDIGTSMITKHA